MFKSRVYNCILILMSLMLSACGFHLRESYLLPDSLNHISVNSYDVYSDITRKVKTQLEHNGTVVVPNAKDVPNLYIISESDNTRTLSLYQNARAADYELAYTVNYRVTIPNQGDSVFRVNITRNFLNNPMAALAKSVEKEIILDEMKEQAAEQIIRKMATLQPKPQETENSSQ